jgi:intracellular multiplication protein IcmP
MPQPQQQQQGSSDGSLDFLWMMGLIVAGIAAIWYFAHNEITAFVFSARLYEIYLIQYVLASYAAVASYLHLPVPNTDGLLSVLNIIHSKPGNVELKKLIDVSTVVGQFLSYPVALIIAVLSVAAYFTNITSRFKHTYSMNTLKKSENRIWPEVTPVMKVDLVSKDLDQGPWAMSLSPMLFAKKHKLLIENQENGHKKTVTLNEGAAQRVFALQVGQFWRNVETLPMYQQALFAIFLSRANHDRTDADRLLAQIAASATSDKLDFSGVKQVVAKYKNSKHTQFATQRHAYVLTAMATLLELARTDGVLATAEFLWLKPVDRPLWYMLNSVGRRTAFAEISGAYAHWLAEKKMNRPLKVPMVDEAVKGLGLALKEITYEPEEE